MPVLIKSILPLFIFTFFYQDLFAQKRGCLDVQANNYDSSAKVNDGSCLYNTTSYVPAIICNKLNDTLIETSGLIFFNNWFWTQNDGGNHPEIIAFDSLTGNIIHRTTIANKTNIDWEEITQDDTNIYIGDFGNNLGDRKDLKIYILKKSDLFLNKENDTVNVNEILFQYADQLSFTPANQNNNFDMEAMCVINDSLHLFSKNWVDKQTRHYIMPKIPGNYTLMPRESFNVDGLITSACINSTNDKIILGGYNTSNGACFMWMLWDYKNNMVFNGNKRKIGLGTIFSLGQFEASTFKTNQLYFTNEKKFTEASLWRAEISQWFTSANNSGYSKTQIKNQFVAFQKDNLLIIETKNGAGYINIYNTMGLRIINHKITSDSSIFQIDQLSSGIYSIEINEVVKKILIEH